MNSYASEVKAKWGNTELYKEYERKTAGYTEENLQSTETTLSEIFAKFAKCKLSGLTPNSAETQATVKELKECITANCYTCTDEILNTLGAMYVTDERFKENIDKHGEGTAEFASEAIKIYTKD